MRRQWPQFYTLSRTRTHLTQQPDPVLIVRHVPKPAACTIALMPPLAVLRVLLLCLCAGFDHQTR